MGSPTTSFRYNDGEVGIIDLVFGPDTTTRSNKTSRPMNAECKFVIEANVGSSVINVDVVGVAKAFPFTDDAEVVRPVSTGVKCVIKLGPNKTTFGDPLNAAGESAVGVGTTRYVIENFQSPITLCATPSAHWSDNKFQVGTEDCVTS